MSTANGRFQQFWLLRDPMHICFLLLGSLCPQRPRGQGPARLTHASLMALSRPVASPLSSPSGCPGGVRCTPQRHRASLAEGPQGGGSPLSAADRGPAAALQILPTMDAFLPPHVPHGGRGRKPGRRVQLCDPGAEPGLSPRTRRTPTCACLTSEADAL